MMNQNEDMNFEHLVELFKQTQDELQKRVARSVDIALVVRNWLFGWYIVEFEICGEERKELYGKKLVRRLSEALTKQMGKGFSRRSIDQFRYFYDNYQKIGQTLPAQSLPLKKKVKEIQQTASVTSTEIGQTLSAQSLDVLFKLLSSQPEVLQELTTHLVRRFELSWSHYVTLLTVKNEQERSFYEIESKENAWCVRELKRQIASSLYERLALSKDKNGIMQLSKKGQVIDNASDIIKNPYVLEFLGLPEQHQYSEHELEIAIINKIEHFLLELGKGFLFEARQKRFTFDDDHFYVDLVFYNRLLRCYVLIDLKREKLTHQDLGQMQMYVNYFDRYVKTEDEKPTVGILLCHTKSDDLVELTLPADSNIYASEYELYLPSKEELRRQLEEAQRDLGMTNE